MTPAEQAIAAQALIDQLTPLVAGVPQEVVLDALLAMFHATAIHHPGCLERAVSDATFVAITLSNRLFLQQAPHGASIH
ncbi:hypothetical protein [Variovorax sp. PAMC26660]|uniref:hypothetical protein n=1 Tax=Variovorax sp. PAMC26660 TaxID=2762322 RepID=UPI00164D44CC|nr:hypothetical protein [Variovorax sp. PAMC26660]QNK69222.1 hypothetical protein H7F35_05790 [Variovorax sp. PAMC26660]